MEIILIEANLESLTDTSHRQYLLQHTEEHNNRLVIIIEANLDLTLDNNS